MSNVTVFTPSCLPPSSSISKVIASTPSLLFHSFPISNVTASTPSPPPPNYPMSNVIAPLLSWLLLTLPARDDTLQTATKWPARNMRRANNALRKKTGATWLSHFRHYHWENKFSFVLREIKQITILFICCPALLVLAFVLVTLYSSPNIAGGHDWCCTAMEHI